MPNHAMSRADRNRIRRGEPTRKLANEPRGFAVSVVDGRIVTDEWGPHMFTATVSTQPEPMTDESMRNGFRTWYERWVPDDGRRHVLMSDCGPVQVTVIAPRRFGPG
jgi:hypothetical protein